MPKINKAVVIGSEEWERFVAEAKNLPTLDSKSWHARKEWGDALAARLSAGDIRKLLRLCAAGAPYYDLLAYILQIHRLSKAQDPRFTPPLRRRWAALVEASVRKKFAMLIGERPPWSWSHWHAADREAAERYLCEELDIGACEPTTASDALSHLRYLARSSSERTVREAAVARLRGIRMAGGPFADGALMHLEGLGFIDPARLEEVARQWREKRDGASLNWLTSHYIERLQPPEGHPLQPVLDLLGEPTDASGYTIIYETRDPAPPYQMQLQLHIDVKTRSTLVGSSLK
jgi:hypothetical protein